jgi:hypothetical protein
MKMNESKNLWRYLRSFTNPAVSLNLLMEVSIPLCVVMALASLLYWDVESHKTNSSMSTAIASPSKFLTDLHPDCSDSGMYQPVLVEEHDEVIHY